MPRGLSVKGEVNPLSDAVFRSDAMKVVASASLQSDRRDIPFLEAHHLGAARSLDASKEIVQTTSTTSVFSFAEVSPWQESDEKITFQISIMVDEGEHMARVPMMLTLFKFCFEELFILFDIPHGGCDYGPMRMKGGPRTVGQFLHSEKKAKILEEAQRVLSQAAGLHSRHCSKPVRTRSDIIDYESDRVRNVWRNTFNLEFEPPTEEQKKWPFAFMWKNSMAYVLAIQDSSNEFVLHVDDDIGIISDTNDGLGAFVKTSLQEFSSTSSLVFSQLAWCNRVETKNLAHFKSDGNIKFYRQKNYEKDHESFVTVQLFMTKRSQFAKMYPLQYWRHFTESLFMVSLRTAPALAVSVEMPGFCKAQFLHGVEGTPLTNEEKARAKISATSFPSDAFFEPFRISEPNGRCKFR